MDTLGTRPSRSSFPGIRRKKPRFKIIALFEEQDGAPPHNGGDGTSASSVGTASPEMFHGEINANIKGFVPMANGDGKHDVIITQSDLSAIGMNGSGLIVRRGSEPALVTMGQVENPLKPNAPALHPAHKRWSSIPSVGTKHRGDSGEDSDDEDEKQDPKPRLGGNGMEKSAFTRFARDSARQSLASNNSAMQRWFEAQDRAEELYDQMQVDRKEPLGSSGTTEEDGDTSEEPEPPDKDEGSIVIMKNSGGPLGIHVVPDYDPDGREMGLVIQGINPGGRIYQDGRLKYMDRITEINGTSLVDVDFQTAQDIFKQALKTEEIRLLVKKERQQLPQHLPSALKKPPLPSSLPPDPPKHAAKRGPAVRPVELNITEAAIDPPEHNHRGIDVEPVSPSSPKTPTKRVPPAVPQRHPSTSLTSPSKDKARYVAPTNTRKIGKKLHIDLTKGSDGLGFSITTRDNPAGGHCPIYIKNILPKGAAIKDGQLKSGDRLLEVNSEEMTGMTQSEAVGILRNTKLGDTVSIVVSRQVLDEDSSKPKNPVPPEKEEPPVSSESTFKPPDVSNVTAKSRPNVPALILPDQLDATSMSSLSPSILENLSDEPRTPVTKNKDIMTFDIPLNETGSAGLGVSVKGKTTTTEQGAQDLGIFIKSVIGGGAAAKDQRLRVNDQLVEVNGESLVGKSNAVAMEILRSAMQKEGPKPGHIHLMIARRKALPPPISVQSIPRDVRISQLDITDGRDAKPFTPTTPGEYTGGMLIELPTDGNNKDYIQPPRNAGLDRLKESVSSVRNTSYMRATHESMLDQTTDSVAGLGGDGRRAVDGVHMRAVPNTKPRPASTLGFTEPPSPIALTGSRSNDNLLDSGAPKEPHWLSQWEHNTDAVQIDETSPDINAGDTFRREGFGRQSMSEKRKGHLDAKLSEFYQQIKRNKDGTYQSATWDRRRSSSCREDKKDPSQIGPTLGLKKSSSLESLQTAVQEVTEDEGSGLWRPPNRGMVRGRGCNESFRAAVDRSYDGPPTDAEAMEPLEEESSESGSLHGQHSTRSSISSSDQGDPAKMAAKKRAKERKEPKEPKDRSSGLFKGLGHMFRFGRHRKPADEKSVLKPGEPVKASIDANQLTSKHVEASKKAREENERLAEQYRKYQEQQKIADQMRAHEESRSHSPGGTDISPNRNERIQQLRAEHQRRHRERQGQYPQDAKEEQYEKQIQEVERKKIGALKSYPHDPALLPPRRRPEDAYDRPQSRQGYADPSSYSHYQNLQEIQAQIKRQEYYQQRYHEYMRRQNMMYQHAHSGSDPVSMSGAEMARADSRQAYLQSRHYSQGELPWSHHHQAVLPQRSVTPSALAMVASMPLPASLPPGHSRSQTPISQLGYPSQHGTALLGSSQHSMAGHPHQTLSTSHLVTSSQHPHMTASHHSVPHLGASQHSTASLAASQRSVASLAASQHSMAKLSASQSQRGKTAHQLAVLPGHPHLPPNYGQYRDYADQRTLYPEPVYGSLGRRNPRDRPHQNVSGPAQV